jgi:hypothetical protein
MKNGGTRTAYRRDLLEISFRAFSIKVFTLYCTFSQD